LQRILASFVAARISRQGEEYGTNVIVFENADPEFFVARVDMMLVDYPHAFDEIASRLKRRRR